jgi:gluconolactonase
MKKNALFILATVLLTQHVFAQRYGVPNFKVVSDFTNEKVFTAGIEGPAFGKKGNLYVVNFQKEGTIGVVDYFGNASLFVELPEGSIGNSIVIDTMTNMMYVADYTKHNILKVDMATKQVSVFVHDDRFNQPNDICRHANGNFYASDPNWKAEQGNIWLIRASGEVVLLGNSFAATNGIALNPAQTILYVTEQTKDMNGVLNNVWEFPIHANGMLGEKELLIKFRDFGMDGMKVDKMGNIYLTRYDKGTVAIISPEGEIIREITLKGKKPSNIAFGGSDGRTCFVTMQDRGCIEVFRMPRLKSWYSLFGKY